MPKSWTILADRVRPQNNVGIRFLDNDIFLRLTAPSSCSTRLPNDQDHLQEIAQLFLAGATVGSEFLPFFTVNVRRLLAASTKPEYLLSLIHI